MKRYLLPVLGSGLLIFSACKKDDLKNGPIVYDNGPTDSLKLNEMQVIASHNSYHLRTDTAVFNFLLGLDSLGVIPSEYDPHGIDYFHEPLDVQLGQYGVRGLELDIYNDPQGGQYYYRAGKGLCGLNAASGIDELLQPGFKMIHIVDFDYNSTNVTFKGGLETVYAWSAAHPNHLPIFINIECKEDVPADVISGLPSLTHSIPYDAAACDAMDAEIKSVFGNNLDKVITPDDVRGNYATLEEAVLAGNWPKLSECRGKVVFIMQGAAESLYKTGHPSLSGRAMFVYSDPGTPEAAFVILNNPVGSFSSIQQRVQQGYIVRTRSDANTDEARSGDYTGMNAAFASWAQIVSTDYYRPDPRGAAGGFTSFQVRFPNNELARIDSISAIGKTNLGLIKE